MSMFIRIKNGHPFEHPILEDNFQKAFPELDPDNLPNYFARFERVAAPVPGTYEVVEGPVYGWIDGVVRDIWTVRQMSAQEKQTKIDAVMALRPFVSWQFDEPSCSFRPPVPYPTDGRRYIWDEAAVTWKEIGND